MGSETESEPRDRQMPVKHVALVMEELSLGSVPGVIRSSLPVDLNQTPGSHVTDFLSLFWVQVTELHSFFSPTCPVKSWACLS